jgi:hypothetical protein
MWLAYDINRAHLKKTPDPRRFQWWKNQSEDHSERIPAAAPEAASCQTIDMKNIFNLTHGSKNPARRLS